MSQVRYVYIRTYCLNLAEGGEQYRTNTSYKYVRITFLCVVATPARSEYNATRLSKPVTCFFFAN